VRRMRARRRTAGLEHHVSRATPGPDRTHPSFQSSWANTNAAKSTSGRAQRAGRGGTARLNVVIQGSTSATSSSPRVIAWSSLGCFPKTEEDARLVQARFMMTEHGAHATPPGRVRHLNAALTAETRQKLLLWLPRCREQRMVRRGLRFESGKTVFLGPLMRPAVTGSTGWSCRAETCFSKP